MSEGSGFDKGQRLDMPKADGSPAGYVGEPEPGHYRAYGLAETFGQYLAMLELRFRTGNRSAFAYHLLGRVEFDPSAGMTLSFPDATVTFRGRNLGPLFTAVRQQQAVWVWEADRAVAELAPDAAALVETIAVEAARFR
jgi:hypothetical protein